LKVSPAPTKVKKNTENATPKVTKIKTKMKNKKQKKMSKILKNKNL